MEKYHI